MSIHCGDQGPAKDTPSWSTFNNIDPGKPLKVKDKALFYRLCYMTAHAYILRDREWMLVHIKDLHDIQFDEALLDSLVLAAEIKDTVKALAWNSSQRTEDSFDADFVEGKGNGQIILLHGAPRVGKTATAECVAELMQRPLISLTCGDLGTEVTAVENNLKKFMTWGQIWNAVALLDEADVYLESRQKGEVDRNALVSVFLRELERYEGIMFLTANRVGTFDDAFLSRVHVGLLFKTLSNEDREKIWLDRFKRLEAEKRQPGFSIHADAEKYVTGNWKKNGVIQDDLINIQWNGREISNAFETALALASYATNGAKKPGEKVKDVVLRPEHIQNVVGMSNQFKIFINDTNKSDEEGRARREMLRGSSDGNFSTKDSSFAQGTATRTR